MTTEKFLEMVNEAINLLDDEGKSAVEFMRKNAVKSASNMSFMYNTGAVLEGIRNELISDIQAAEAKKNGKSNVLSAIKKYAKQCFTRNISVKPALAYTDMLTDGRYVTLDGYSMLITENSDGLTMKPDNVTGRSASDVYEKSVPKKFANSYELPELGKLKSWVKVNKAQNKRWREPFFFNKNFAVDVNYLITGMLATGSTELFYNDNRYIMCLKGNGNEFYIMPVQRKDNTPDTVIE